jgi:hypothetical protein
LELTFKVEQEEGVVLLEGAFDGGAKLVALERRVGGGEEVRAGTALWRRK